MFSQFQIHGRGMDVRIERTEYRNTDKPFDTVGITVTDADGNVTQSFVYVDVGQVVDLRDLSPKPQTVEVPFPEVVA